MNKAGILALTLLIVLAIAGCHKYETGEQETNSQGISFSIAPGSNLGNLKSTDTINCFSEQADYAIVQIDDSSYKVDVFYIGDMPFTTTLKLSTGTHTLKEFTMWSDNNTPASLADDELLAAAPHSGSNFSAYVVTPLNIPFLIEPFAKVEFPIEVVCFEEDNYDDFGFQYFQINGVLLHEESFFGDLCAKNPDDYIGSLYEQQSTGLQYDMPAIFKIEVWRNGTIQQTFSNETWHGEGEPLTVRYGDYVLQTDAFEFKLYILVRKGSWFDYVYFYSWFTTDDQKLPQGSDGVVEFALGNCVPDADVILPPWINLPNTCTYKIIGAYAPGSKGGYVDAQLSNIPSGYELYNGVEASWCADHQTNISTGTTYNMSVYSSLYQNQLPAFAQSPKWEKINWLMNHLDWYPGYQWYDVQGAIWLFDNPPWNGQAHSGVPALTPMMQQMHNDASNYGSGYKVLPGGWACIVFIPAGTPPNATNATVQTMFTKVDP